MTCPDLGERTPATDSIGVQSVCVRGASDPDVGIRLIRCTRCGHRGEARLRCGRLAFAPVA